MSLPLVCTLAPETVRTRRAALLPGLLACAAECVAIDDGYRLRFEPASDLLAQIAQVIDAERQCCRFLTFQVTAEPELGPVWLTVSGPAGTREFLDALRQERAG